MAKKQNTERVATVDNGAKPEEIQQRNAFDIDDEPSERAAERQRQREQKLKAIRFLEIPNMASKKLIGEEFDIIDAVRSRFQDEINVAFIIVMKRDGEKYSVKKPLNTYTEAYLDYFESFTPEEEVPPMEGYTFVELSEGGQAGQKPVVLRKV